MAAFRLTVVFPVYAAYAVDPALFVLAAFAETAAVELRRCSLAPLEENRYCWGAVEPML